MTRVKEGDFYEEEVADLDETISCTVLESADGVRPMGQRICFEDADPLALVSGRWRVADEVKGVGEDPDSTRILMIRL